VIRNVKDVTALLDRRCGGAMGRPLSVLRTLVGVGVGLYLIGLLMPAPQVHLGQTKVNQALRNEPVRDLMLDKNDPRGWKRLKPDPHKFTVAWVGGSTIQTVKPHHYGFVPVDFLHRVPKIDGKPVRVSMYLMEASRIYDLYAATAEALASKPDMLVLDLNPLWIFNPNAIQSWPNLNSVTVPNIASRPGSWPLMAALYSPSDAALSLASGHLASIRDRWSYAQKLRNGIDKLSPLTEPTAAPGSAGKLHGVQLIATMQSSLNFWNYYRLIPNDTPVPQRYPAMLRQAVTDGSALNDRIVDQLLAMLADAKIPTFAYMSAVDPSTLTNPATDRALHAVEDHLHGLANDNRGPRLEVQWQSGTRFVQGLQFRDMVHMTYDPPMADLLATRICAHLTAVDPHASCVPKLGSPPR
jgi:hypothetical protein